MSFILDALKKSESDRQRQAGPSLYEVRALPPRVKLPVWAVTIVALLGVNLVIVTWMLLRRPAAPPPAAPAEAHSDLPALPAPEPQHAYAEATPPPQTYPSQAQPLPQPGAAPGAYPSPPGSVPQGYPQPAAQGTAMNVPPQPLAPAGTAGGWQGAPRQPQDEGPQGTPRWQGEGADPRTASMQGTGADAAGQTGNPDDYAPATEPTPDSLGGHVMRGTASGLPLYPDADAAPAAGLPPLHLDFHVYAADPDQRFVMINMHKLREGETGPNGIRVDSITADGAIISHGDSRYFLPRP